MKLAMYDLEGHLLEIFEGDNISQISKLIGVGASHLHNCINGKVLSAKLRQYKEVFMENPLHKIGDISKCTHGNKYSPVFKYYKGKYICTYRNAHNASSITKIDEPSINECLNGKRLTAGGFEWKIAF